MTGWSRRGFEGGREERHDDGRILLLLLGCVVVLAMLVAVVSDAARLYLARRSLDATTDAAALAGAQAVDLDAVYAGRAVGQVPLDPVRVGRDVRAYLDESGAADQLESFAVTEVTVVGDQVTVATRSVVRLPFVGAVTRGTSTVTVRSTATARNHVLPP